MVLLEGKPIAELVIRGIMADPLFSEFQKQSMTAIVIDPTEEIRRFVGIKQRLATRLGMGFTVKEFPRTVSKSECIRAIEECNASPQCVGTIIQLPVPEFLDTHEVFNTVRCEKDIDVLSDAGFQNFFYHNSPVVPPVAGAIAMLCRAHDIPLAGRSVAVIGAGRLIGLPVLAWFSKQGAIVYSFRDRHAIIPEFLISADIVVAGSGDPESVTGSQLKDGVVVFDVGFSVQGGVAKGDVQFSSAQSKARMITPVPGGIGPLTVACLFKNALELVKQRG
jgi:methylenetetrahydrofolate dehydrogenase (NADP+)/methenyltetrahydrofolate cyclohydrolase